MVGNELQGPLALVTPVSLLSRGYLFILCDFVLFCAIRFGRLSTVDFHFPNNYRLRGLDNLWVSDACREGSGRVQSVRPIRFQETAFVV